ncbi:hypothetical protein B0H13DRAFT_1851021 [Mycena leptocephala]|nr:hypothetical protein B0H13DRAFT_1851021 [Mycena leptocephala]
MPVRGPRGKEQCNSTHSHSLTPTKLATAALLAAVVAGTGSLYATSSVDSWGPAEEYYLFTGEATERSLIRREENVWRGKCDWGGNERGGEDQGGPWGRGCRSNGDRNEGEWHWERLKYRVEVRPLGRGGGGHDDDNRTGCSEMMVCARKTNSRVGVMFSRYRK